MLLAIYLNDHLAGATAGRELARRAAANNRGQTYGAFLERLAHEVEEDRLTLLSIMRELGVGVDRFKLAAGWGAEKLGRLKLNGRVRGYSPLSRVLELEGLILGVHGKLELWRKLAELQSTTRALTEVDLRTLINRAERQLEELEQHSLRSASEAFAGA
jgi:hypothetical protein